MTREERAHELRELSHSNPQRLIALYRVATAKDELGQLPNGLTFAAMITAILDYEGPLTCPKAAGTDSA